MKSLKNIWILIITVIGFSAYSCKTEEIILHGDLSGKVIDAETGQPINTAMITISQINDTTISASDGTYNINNLIPGNYDIQVSKPSYETDTKGISVASARTENIDFALNGIPVPEISVKYLDFGLDSVRKSFTISNTGMGRMDYFITGSQGWVHLSSTSGDVTNETDTIFVTIDKNGLPGKKHIEAIKVYSLAGKTIKQDTVKVFLNGVMDIDHNYYNVVKIGNQTWMAENLNTGRFITTGNNQTNNNIVEKYCYGNTYANCSISGGYYKWDEMMQYQPQDSGKTGIRRGVCPVGWHIPTQFELYTLEDNAGGGNVAGGNLKETGLDHWNVPNTGATNITGFTAVGGGAWDGFNKVFGGLKGLAVFNSSTYDAFYGSFVFTVTSDSASSGSYFDLLKWGNALSVRCVKDPLKK
jgi:uncharacterized protein (TIGR02145 family)